MALHADDGAAADEYAVLQATLAFVDEFPLSPVNPLQDHELHDAALRHQGQQHREFEMEEEVQGGRELLVELLRPHPSERPHEQDADSHSIALSSSRSSNKMKKKKISWNPNKARDERRDELIYLRSKVVELETQLRDVQRKRPRLSARSSSEPPSPSSTGEDAASVRASEVCLLQHQPHPAVRGVWQDIARRQSEARMQSERENIRLRLVLEHQLRVAKSLEKLLNSKSSTKEMEKCVHGARLHSLFASTTERADAAIFADLLSGLDQSYAEVDAVFQANGLASRETPLNDARMRFDVSKGMCLEMFANKVLPFDMHTTATVAWQHFIFGKQRTPSRFYDFISTPSAETTDDTIVENFNIELHAKNTSGLLRVKQVLRRYLEEERIVIVLRAIFYPVELADEPMSDVWFRKTGYIVVKRPSAIPEDYSLLQTCYIYSSLVGDDHPKVGAVTDFMLRATEANITASHQMIENVLLAQAGQHHRDCARGLDGEEHSGD